MGWFDDNAPADLAPPADWFAQNAPQPGPIATASPEGRPFAFLPRSGAQTDAADARDIAQGPVPPFVRGLGSAVGEAIPQSLGQAGRMVAEGLTPSIGGIEDAIQEPQRVAGVYQGLQEGKPLRQAIEEMYGKHKTFDEFNAEDWGKLTGQVGLKVAGALPFIGQGSRILGEISMPRAGATLPEAIAAQRQAGLEQAVTGEPNAVQEPSAGSVLQRQPQETGITGSERGGVEPSIQGTQAPQAQISEPTPEAQTPLGTAGTSNRQNTITYGENTIPSGTGVDTSQLLDNARFAISSGAVDPYSVLSKTRSEGVASPKEYATLAAEHERLVNEAVALDKAGDPTAPEAAQRAEDFANAIQPHKTAASDLFRLMQGDLNYDLGSTFGIDQYMKSELGRGMKPSERPTFENYARGIRQAEAQIPDAVARADANVQRSYARVADISMEEAVNRIKKQLEPCL